ncbi:MAG: hypothetical protein GX848_02895 [Clostridiales bacterium]|jgi:uncharacterized membrane protein YhdT|nr:hypothetical protein [Clostridiales bacterium]
MSDIFNDDSDRNIIFGSTTDPQLVGFSSKITDPSFLLYQKKTEKWALLFSFVIAAAALIGFPLYGSKTGKLDFPQSLYIGLVLALVFIVILILQTIKRRIDKTWDGVVIDKKAYTKRDYDDNGSGSIKTEYMLKVKKESGRIKTHKWHDNPALYDYYNIGDKVRHHKGFQYYEKHDKSDDAQILCSACLTINDIDGDSCKHCKCPLLK